MFRRNQLHHEGHTRSLSLPSSYVYQSLIPMWSPPAYLNARSPFARCTGCRRCSWLEGSPPAASTWCWPRGRSGVRPASHSAAPDTESRNVIEACSAGKDDKSYCGLPLMLTTEKIWREASITQHRSWYRKKECYRGLFCWLGGQVLLRPPLDADHGEDLAWGQHSTVLLLIQIVGYVIEACSADKEDKCSCGLHLMLITRKIWCEASITQRRSW